MRAPMIPGRKPDDDQREAMLRRLGIAEEKPPMPSSRWDVLARDMEPVAPVQTPPPPTVDEVAAPEPLAIHQPIPMAEAMHTQEALAPEPEPVAPPPVMEAPVPILRAVEPEPAPQPVAEPVLAIEPEPAPAPETRVPDASFMPGWGEESIPEDEDVEAEAFDEPAPLASAPEAPRMDEPLAEAPCREEILPTMERPLSYSPQPAADMVANDQDLDIPEPQAATPAPPPVMEAPLAPPLAAAPVAEPVVEVAIARAPIAEPIAEPVVEPAPAPVAVPQPVAEAPVFRQPVIEPPAPEPEPVVQRAAPVLEPAPEPVIQRAAPSPEPAPEPVVQRAAPAPAPEPEPPVAQRAAPAPEPIREPPVVRQAPPPEPVVEAAPPVAPKRAERQPEPEPAPAASAAPPVDSALKEMRAELEAMRKQFQTAPAPPVEAAPLAAAIPYDGRRRSSQQTDFFANARMVVWTLAIVAALWVTFHGMKAAQAHHAKQDHILATVTGKEAADDPSGDQKSDN